MRAGVVPQHPPTILTRGHAARIAPIALAATPSNYNTVLDVEEWMRAFSGRLCSEAGTARSAYRWLDPPELESYANGTFESRVEGDHTRRGFKALSMNPGLNFDMRSVVLKVPLDHVIRKSIRCVPYTIMPRDIDAPDERISDAKNMAFVAEAEVQGARLHCRSIRYSF